MRRLLELSTAILLSIAAVTTSIADSDHAGHSDHTKAHKLGPLELSGYWARASLPGTKVSGGYVTITNHSDTADKLIDASAVRSGRTEIHQMSVTDGIMTMRPIGDGGLEIPAHSTVELKPGGFHIMFMKLPEPFKAGETVEVNLTFEKAGETTLALPIKPLKKGQTGHGHGDHDANHDHDHGHNHETN